MWIERLHKLENRESSYGAVNDGSMCRKSSAHTSLYNVHAIFKLTSKCYKVYAWEFVLYKLKMDLLLSEH